MVRTMQCKPIWNFGDCAVIVAHPDDETIWAGGTMLMHPETKWTVLTLSRASDADRSAKFSQAMKYFSACGKMADLDDGPEQLPLPIAEVQKTILSVLPETRFDLIITHSPWGEYTCHLRHEETGKAVLGLWENGKLSADEMWFFAYESGEKEDFARPIKTAHRIIELPEKNWQEKYRIITEIYDFKQESFEAKTSSKQETFWCFNSAGQACKWFYKGGVKNESAGAV